MLPSCSSTSVPLSSRSVASGWLSMRLRSAVGGCFAALCLTEGEWTQLSGKAGLKAQAELAA